VDITEGLNITGVGATGP